jgi:histidinol-phosphate aminotransferase
MNDTATTANAEKFIRPRRGVQALSAYVPPLEGRRALIRLDFNENTRGFPELLSPGTDPVMLNTYPEYGDFINALAQLHGIPSDWLMLTNGSDEALAVISSTFIEPEEDIALVSSPTFPLIPHYLKLAGARLMEVPVIRETLAYDVETIAGVLREEKLCGQPVKLLIAASPDNPTGGTLPRNVLLDWCRENPDTLFVIDEAYAEYCNCSMLQDVLITPNLIITRTFSKAWGLAGLRLGFAVANPTYIQAMTCVRSPYSVNTAAVTEALRLLPHAKTIQSEALATVERKKSLIEAVGKFGYPVLEGAGNFFLLAAGIESRKLQDFARSNGILIRDRSSMTALGGTVRVSVGTEDENQAFLDCLTRYRATSALIFDLDETLIDTTRSFTTVVLNLVARYSGHALEPAELWGLRALGGFNDDWDATVELLRRRGIDVPRDEIAEVGTQEYLAIASQVETLLFEDPLLENLSKRFRLFVLTGRYRREYDSVWGKRLDPLFERVYCRDDLDHCQPKPSGEGLKHCLSAHCIHHAYYIGNSVDDMQAATEAGLAPIGVTTVHDEILLRQAGAKHVIPGVQALERLFSR